jgi:nucleotide-binding universal stress UspA family protein
MKRILVAVDGSEHSVVAARFALDWAKHCGATLEGLHVIGPGALPPTDKAEEGANAGAYRKEEEKADLIQRTGEVLLGEMGRWATDAGVVWVSSIERGEIVPRILAHSDSTDITVLGALGHSRDPLQLVGSTAAKVAAEAIRPVLVTRGEHKPIRRVLIGYNRTDGAANAVSFAAQWAAMEGWEIRLVTGADYVPEGEEIVARAKKFLGHYGLSCETRVTIPADGTHAIFTALRDYEPDLILIGSRGRGTIARMILGSTSYLVLEQAPCSVMIFR